MRENSCQVVLCPHFLIASERNVQAVQAFFLTFYKNLYPRRTFPSANRTAADSWATAELQADRGTLGRDAKKQGETERVTLSGKKPIEYVKNEM